MEVTRAGCQLALAANTVRVRYIILTPRTAIEGRKKARFTGGKTVVTQTILGDATRR